MLSRTSVEKSIKTVKKSTNDINQYPENAFLFRVDHWLYHLHHYICSTDSVPHEKTFRVGLFHTKLSQRHDSMKFLAKDFALTLLNYFFSSFPDICQFQSTASEFQNSSGVHRHCYLLANNLTKFGQKGFLYS